MTAQVVQEYFLKAGASFRKSNAWRQDHEDTQGHSRVLRTGRFGVGALAAFLLGDEIEVTTRHVFALPTDGATFRARLDDEAISLIRVPAPAGTKVRINVPKRLQESVKRIVPGEHEDAIYFGHPAGHYFLTKPSLKREFSNRSRKFEPGYWLPLPTDGESIIWRCFSNNDFEKVFWTYLGPAPTLACNGIVIDGFGSGLGISELLRRPNLSVFDKDGYLPVNLQRTGLQGQQLPFANDLLRSITDDLVAHALVDAPSNPKGTWLDGSYEGFARRSTALGGSDQWAKWLIGREGFILNAPHLLHSYNPKVLIVAIGCTYCIICSRFSGRHQSTHQKTLPGHLNWTFFLPADEVWWLLVCCSRDFVRKSQVTAAGARGIANLANI
jgi:molecular chaperone HtpG